MAIGGLSSLFDNAQNQLQALREAFSERKPAAADAAAQSDVSGQNQRRPTPVPRDQVQLSGNNLVAEDLNVPVGEEAKKELAEVQADISERIIGESLDAIVGRLAEVFSKVGGTFEEALNKARSFVAGLKEAIASAEGEFSFSFEQSFARFSSSSVAYAGADGAGFAETEQAYSAFQSLDIYINKDTGEFSFDFTSAQIEVTTTVAVAQAPSAGQLSSVLDRLIESRKSFSNAVESGQDAVSKALEDFLNEAVEVAREQGGENEPAPFLLVPRELEDVSDSVQRLRVDLQVPLGFFDRNGRLGASFQPIEGEALPLKTSSQNPLGSRLSESA
ncbi:hypothetical protein [Kiloniella sp. b19]|uniref:hypothetical protein n=1 Tax=Kiloniella sp. GXU_MW_B19 TaxID=3141326 RepID=UPI0031D454E2